jgi:hypothetical protein
MFMKVLKCGEIVFREDTKQGQDILKSCQDITSSC